MVRKISTEAVSPVVGVMLMLVVTIIIAAVVSAFGMGALNDKEAAPSVQIKYVGMMDGDLNEAGKIGMIFESVSGEKFKLTDISFKLSDDVLTENYDGNGNSIGTTLGHEAVLAYSDMPSATIQGDGPSATTATLGAAYKQFPRFSKIPLRAYGNDQAAISDTAAVAKQAGNILIESGERFIVLVDKISVEDGHTKFYVVAERGSASNPYSSGWFELDERTKYSIVHTPSGSAIANGRLTETTL